MLARSLRLVIPVALLGFTFVVPSTTDATGKDPLVALGKSDKSDDADDRPKNVRQQRSTRHMKVVARSCKLSKRARIRLQKVARLYHEESGRKLVITGGDRNAYAQARLMFRKLEDGEDVISLYIHKTLVVEIVDAYRESKDDDSSDKEIIRKMKKVIQRQMDNDEYISRHLQFTAADVRSRDMSDDEFAAFVAAVKSVKGARWVDERNTSAPHLHLSL